MAAENGFDRPVLGIQIGHDATAAVVLDGGIVAAVAEERFSRQKGHSGVPYRAIHACLKIAGVDANELGAVALAMSQLPMRYLRTNPTDDPESKTMVIAMRDDPSISDAIEAARIDQDLGVRAADYIWVDHHLSHAASAYFTSGWESCLAVTVDATDGEICATANDCRDGQIVRVAQSDHDASPGYFYVFATERLGYKRLRHEGKLTGLAAYDSGDELYEEFRRVIALSDDGDKFVVGFDTETTPHSLWPYTPLAIPEETLVATNGKRAEQVAAAAQRVFEGVIVEHVAAMCARTGHTRVALAGGAFANVRLNQKIAELDGVTDVYVHPNMGDGGLAMGAALMVERDLRGDRDLPSRRIAHVFYGPSYATDDIRAAIRASTEPHVGLEDPEGFVARLLAAGKVVGWYDGAMEYGPRALGHRSILAAPTDPSINDWLNERLQRTEFMPFAPAVLDRAAPQIFANYEPGRLAAEFMTITFDVHPEWRERIPAVVHVDGTARPQVVRREVNPSYYRIIEEFERLTGLPVVLNTSFNLHEERIVESPRDALRSFGEGRLDALVMGGVAVSRDESILAAAESERVLGAIPAAAG